MGHAWTGGGSLEINNSQVTLASVTVPAGSYLIFAEATLISDDNSDQNGFCKLTTPDGDVDTQDVVLTGTPGTVSNELVTPYRALL